MPRLTAPALVSVTVTVLAALASGQAGQAATVSAGFAPVSASFTTTDSGYVLGSVHCPPGHRCIPHLVRTSDAGLHWQVLPDPPRATFDDQMVFATGRTGWLYGAGGLWVTRNGGGRWRKTAVRGIVWSLAVSAGTVYAAITRPHASVAGLYRSPVGRSAWRQVAGPAGPPEPVLAASGRSAWFDGGATIWTTSDGGHWHQYPFACKGAQWNLTGIAPASATQVRFLCTSSAAFNTGSEGMEIMASSDGGRTEHFAGRKAPIEGDGGVIAVPPGRGSVITFATLTGIPAYIMRSGDGGATFRRVAFYHEGGWNSLSYLSPTTAWIVDVGVELLQTTDSGRTWHKTSF